MDNERRKAIEAKEENRTSEEIIAGWHFCYDWDGMLIGPDDPEREACTCPIIWGDED